MPDPRDDLIRRGDVLVMLERFGADEDSAVCRDARALPADPVAAAALALAEALDAADAARRSNDDVTNWPSNRAEFAALAAYRAALAGRERGR